MFEDRNIDGKSKPEEDLEVGSFINFTVREISFIQ